MRCTLLACTLLSVSTVLAGPLNGLYKRQDDTPTSGAIEESGGGDGPATERPVATVIQGGDEPVTRPTAGDGDGNIGSRTTEGRDGSSPTTATTTPSSVRSDTPVVGEDECPPCGSETSRETLPSGKECFCIDGGKDTAPWAWGPETCIVNGQFDTNDEGRPLLCIGSGTNPASRQCLNNCNFMTSTVKSANPCNPNLYNAAQSCASCASTLLWSPNGKEPSPDVPSYYSTSSAFSFMNSMKDWCARPSRCIDLATGGKISGQGGCPVLANGGGGSGSPIVVRGGTGAVITDSAGREVSARILTTSTISTTDSEGRPVLSLAVMTVDNPSYTANTQFAGARGTAPASDSNGGASPSFRWNYLQDLLNPASLTTLLGAFAMLAHAI